MGLRVRQRPIVLSKVVRSVAALLTLAVTLPTLGYALHQSAHALTTMPAPVVTITNPVGDFINDKGITLTGTITNDPDHYYLVIKNDKGIIVGGPGVVYKKDTAVSWQWDTSKYKDGEKYTIDFEAAGENPRRKDDTEGKSVVHKTVTVDTTAPTIVSVTPNATQTVGGTINAGVTASDTGSGVNTCSYAIEGTSLSGSLPCDGTSTAIDVSSLMEGDYKIDFTVTDKAGNIFTKTGVITFHRDVTPPLVTLKVLGSSTPMASTAVTFNGTVDTTDLKTLVLMIDGKQVTDLTNSIDANGKWAYTLSDGLAQGSHTISAVATDVNGNESTGSTSPDSVITVTMSAYIPPVGSGSTILPVQTQNLAEIAPQIIAQNNTPTITVIPTPTPTGTQNDQAVLGAKTSKDSDSANLAATPVVTPSENGWKLLGIAWYWWLLAFAVGVGAIWTTSVLKRRRQTA